LHDSLPFNFCPFRAISPFGMGGVYIPGSWQRDKIPPFRVTERPIRKGGAGKLARLHLPEPLSIKGNYQLIETK
jgi:hypothetical protein